MGPSENGQRLPPLTITEQVVQSGISAVLHRLGVADKCVTVERPMNPGRKEALFNFVPVLSDNWLQYVEGLMQHATCILVSMRTVTPGLEMELSKILEIDVKARTLVIGPRNSMVTSVGSNLESIDCNPYYRQTGPEKDELMRGVLTYENIIAEALRKWLKGKIELPDAMMLQGLLAEETAARQANS